MEGVLLLAILIGAPIVVVGGVQILIFKLLGGRVLRGFCAAVALVCSAALVSEALAPPIYGSKSGYVGLTIAALLLLLIENLLIVFAPLFRRFMAFEKAAEVRRASQDFSGKEE